MIQTKLNHCNLKKIIDTQNLKINQGGIEPGPASSEEEGSLRKFFLVGTQV